MRFSRAASAALLGGLLLASAATAAAETLPDPSVGRKLKEAGYKYQVDDDGDYRLILELDDGRTQLVFVRSPVETFGSHRVREIWSPAYMAGGDAFPALVANRLLEASADLKLGSWVKQGRHAMLVVKIDANAPAAALDEAVSAAAVVADSMEMELADDPDADEF